MSPPVFLTLRHIVLLSLVWAASADAAEQDWVTTRTIEGVKVEAQVTPSGFKIHRADVLLCTEIANLRAYIADTSRFHEWIPDVDQVRLLDVSDASVVYYMKTKAPWPFRPRDMIYQLTEMRVSGDPSEVSIAIRGLPSYLPEANDASRMREVKGQWRIVSEGKGLRVTYQLFVNPGSVPKFFANRRVSTSLARTLINLRRQFQCQAEP